MPKLEYFTTSGLLPLPLLKRRSYLKILELKDCTVQKKLASTHILILRNANVKIKHALLTTELMFVHSGVRIRFPRAIPWEGAMLIKLDEKKASEPAVPLCDWEHVFFPSVARVMVVGAQSLPMLLKYRLPPSVFSLILWAPITRQNLIDILDFLESHTSLCCFTFQEDLCQVDDLWEIMEQPRFRHLETIQESCSESEE